MIIPMIIAVALVASVVGIAQAMGDETDTKVTAAQEDQAARAASRWLITARS